MRDGIATALALLLAACSSTNNTSAPNGATPSSTNGDPGAATAVAKNLTCVALLQCAVDTCGERDDACQSACFARGTDDGQAKAQTLVGCLSANNCQDADCLESHCSTEYAACLTVPASSGGKPVEGAAPTGSVPPDFVGTWKYTSGGRADDFTFNADGTASRKQLETSSFSGCSSSVAFEWTGTVVFNAAKDGFTFYVTTATNTSNACGQSTSSAGSVGAFDFTLEAIPALGPGKYWFFRVQDCPVTAEADKRIQCGNEYDLAN
jgi:hypothetical protein